MSGQMNGVVRKSDYILIRYGLCDFTQDGSFNPDTEEQHEVPEGTPLYPLYVFPPNQNLKVTHWNGDSWDLIDRI